MKKMILLIAAIIICSISATGLSAQNGVNPSAEKSYIYCIASFGYIKVDKEMTGNPSNNKAKREYALTMNLDCRQLDDDLKSIFGVVNDEEGKPRVFASEIVGINWLGRMGWELITYPSQYNPERINKVQYWFRMDVTGLSTDDINRKLEKLKTAELQ